MKARLDAAAARRCGPAATISRATFISSASARPASCSARSRSPSRRCRRARGCATRRSSTACATRSTRASARSLPGDRRRDRVGADHRQARRDLDAGQRRDVHLRPRRTCCRSRAITWRWSRASCSSSCARCSRSSPCSRCATPIKKWAALARAASRRVLSAAVRRGGRDPALLHHDRRSCWSA